MNLDSGEFSGPSRPINRAGSGIKVAELDNAPLEMDVGFKGEERRVPAVELDSARRAARRWVVLRWVKGDMMGWRGEMNGSLTFYTGGR